MPNFFAKSPTIPDLSSINIMFCVPCGDGRYEKSFINSLFNTYKELECLGAKAKLSEFPYCADLSLARAKLLGGFYRSNCTHLFFVDSDMGWKPQDVVRLILHERDFIGAAGPKKRYPLTFAADMNGDDGKPMPVLQEGTGLIEVKHVGMAFVLLSRSCVERVYQAHPELEFDSDDKLMERALFEPMIVGRRRLSEDFAYCRRWRDLGGKIHILPDVILSHTGSHTFTGALEYSFDDHYGNNLDDLIIINPEKVTA